MKRIVLWFSLLFMTIAINIFLLSESNKTESIRFAEQSTAQALAVSTVEESPTPTIFIPDISLMFTGDVMLGRTVMTKSKELNDYMYPFRFTSDLLNSADLTIVNLENPIISDCPIHTGGFTFCSEPQSVTALEFAGIDIVNLANNHTYNWGTQGFEQTISLLEESNIQSVGYDNVVYKKIYGINLAFLGFDFVTNPYELSFAQQNLIQEADESSDYLIINVHWGNEYKNSANIHQRNMTKRFVELGADLIIGHHPHWVQDAECYLDNNIVKSISADELQDDEGCPVGAVPVYYSLGNFVFDQMWSEETKKGIAVQVNLRDGTFISSEIYPSYMRNWAQPEWTSVE